MQFSYYNILELFGLSEIILFLLKRSKKGEAKNRDDKNSLLLLWISIPVCLITAGFISGYQLWMFSNQTIATDVGIGLAIAGFLVRWTAIIQLGKMFTVDVAISNAHTLKNTGLYKIVRHPSYTGLIFILTGLIISMDSILACIALVPFYLAMNYRIIVEERALIKEFGDQYLTYKKNTGRLIPGIN